VEEGTSVALGAPLVIVVYWVRVVVPVPVSDAGGTSELMVVYVVSVVEPW